MAATIRPSRAGPDGRNFLVSANPNENQRDSYHDHADGVECGHGGPLGIVRISLRGGFGCVSLEYLGRDAGVVFESRLLSTAARCGA